MRVGLNLPQYEIDVATRLDGAAVATIARHAEDLGFDDIWLSDHPFAIAPDGTTSGALEVTATLGFVAGATSRVGLGTLVLAGSMRDPAQTEAIARTVSRPLTLGVGAGWYEPEHVAFGVRRGSLSERVEGLRRHLEAAKAGGARVLVGGAGAGVRALAASHADVWNVAWDVPAVRYHALAATVDRGVSRSVGLTVLCGNEATLIEAVERLRAKAPFMGSISLEALRDTIIVGDGPDCARRIREYPVDEVVLTLAARDDVAMLERFAETALPLLHE
jgi:alkanesulfonate monooxygenase SsuD/methylene tetrahydromethanopterin reductase-like flavin-dependent oxidoreductase (luciferase family)